MMVTVEELQDARNWMEANAREGAGQGTNKQVGDIYHLVNADPDVLADFTDNVLIPDLLSTGKLHPIVFLLGASHLMAAYMVGYALGYRVATQREKNGT